MTGCLGDCGRSHGVLLEALCCVRDLFCFAEYRRILVLRWDLERGCNRWEFNLNMIGNTLNTIVFLSENPTRFSDWGQTVPLDCYLDNQWMAVAESSGNLGLTNLQDAALHKHMSLVCRVTRNHGQFFDDIEARRASVYFLSVRLRYYYPLYNTLRTWNESMS